MTEREEEFVSNSPFTARFEDLPATLAIFPLANAVLLPRQVLPLNIFEPRYLCMVQDALRSDRHIGMVQPRPTAGTQDPVPVYGIGCAGRITTFQETDDGRLLIRLTGVCRFQAVEEMALHNGYRRVRPDWQPYRADLGAPPEPPMGFAQLEGTLRSYFQQHQLEASWEALSALPPALLVDFLAVNLPFDVEEKQALVEAPGVIERAKRLQTALEMAVRVADRPGTTLH